LADYRYEANLIDSIYKTALLLKLQDYRNPQVSTDEAIRIRKIHQEQKGIDQLVITGMGKQALSGIMKWINEELSLKLSHTDLLSGITINDVPDEIQFILNQLKSKEAKDSPALMPVAEAQEEAKTDEEEIEAIAPRQLELNLETKSKPKKSTVTRKPRKKSDE
jgi:hypothetical protein